MDFEKREIIIENVRKYFDIAEKIFNVEFQMPSIRFDLRGKVAGEAHWLKWELRFNETLMQENFDVFSKQTVGHEVAHLVDHKLFSWQYRGMKRYPAHGKGWKKVMMVFGLKPDRCHTYNTSNSVGRRTKKFVYECQCCGANIEMGAVRHKRMKTGERIYYHSYCGKQGKLIYICPA